MQWSCPVLGSDGALWTNPCEVLGSVLLSLLEKLYIYIYIIGIGGNENPYILSDLTLEMSEIFCPNLCREVEESKMRCQRCGFGSINKGVWEPRSGSRWSKNNPR
jgi:hypothetical protein